MKKIIKVSIMLFLVVYIFNFLSPVYAADSNILNTIFSKGGSFFKNNIENSEAKQKANLFTKELTAAGGVVDTIKTIGYLVFFIFGALLGVKYMFSGVEGKTFAKNGIVSYTVGAVFFYLADQIYTFIYSIFKNNISGVTSYQTLEGSIWTTFSNVISMVVVLIVVIYGLKYMWSSADNKAKLKEGLIPMLVGAILIMCTLQVLKYIVAVTQSTIGNDTTYNISLIKEYGANMIKKMIC